MTLDEFERAVAATRLRARARRMARAVLVEGIGQTEAAAREGVTRQLAHDAVQRVLVQHQRLGGWPIEWVAVTVVVPPDAADEVRAIARREARAAGLSL